MFNEIAPYYDYFKQHRDYRAEAIELSALLGLDVPQAGPHRILDVGCGTGTLLSRLIDTTFVDIEASGLDSSAEMLIEARAKLPPEVKLFKSEFIDFEPETPYTSVVWVDGAIGYVPPEDIEEVLENFSSNCMDDDSALIIEPWYDRASWSPGENFIVQHKTKDGGIYIRISRGNEDGSMIFHHLIADEKGVKYIEHTSLLYIHDYDFVQQVLISMGLSTMLLPPSKNYKRGLILARKLG